VVHRDISSTNVLIRNDGKTLLMDFGIALLVGEERLSMAGQVFGNPVYISPEQCVSPEEVGTPADLFALGVLTYQMLSGSLPFSGKTYNELMAQRLTRDPVPLSERRPGLPGELCRFVHRMMDREPGRRPSAGEVVDVMRAAGRTLQRSRADAGPAAVRFEPEQICLVCMTLHGLDAVTTSEQTQELLAAWFAATRQVVQERGGAWSGAGSHRVYGCFGPDAAREALVSVRAATSAVSRLAQLHGAPVSVRAGLAVGQAFVGHDGAPAMAGPVVDLAERLAASDLDQAALRLDETSFALVFSDALAGGKKVLCRKVGEVLFVHGWEGD
jgi:class 3 adenylate cyclase